MDDGSRVLMQAPERFMNSSDAPNTDTIGESDVALRDINAGEELTSKYPLKYGADGEPYAEKLIPVQRSNPDPEAEPEPAQEPAPEPEPEPEPETDPDLLLGPASPERAVPQMGRVEALEVLGLAPAASLEDIEKATKRQARRSRRNPEDIAAISAAAVALNCEWALPQVRVEAASDEWGEIPTPEVAPVRRRSVGVSLPGETPVVVRVFAAVEPPLLDLLSQEWPDEGLPDEEC